MSKITFDPDKHFAEELKIIIQMFDNRHASGDPLTASEILVQIPRDKYERLCRLSLEAIQNRYKQSNAKYYPFTDDTKAAFIPPQNPLPIEKSGGDVGRSKP